MPSKENNDYNRTLEEVYAELKSVNKQVKKFLVPRVDAGHANPAMPFADEPRDARPVSVEELHDKMSEVNASMRTKLALQRRITEGAAGDFARYPNVKEEAVKSSTGNVTVNHSTPTGNDREKVPELKGVGLDLGTSNLVSSRRIEGGHVYVRAERNAFLSVHNDQGAMDLLSKSGIKYATLGEDLYVMGDLALKFASIFNREVHHPMSMGILNPAEHESTPLIKIAVQNILGLPRVDRETCCFSVPADPVDRDQDTIYHRSIFAGILNDLGFDPVVVDEGYAVVLSELGDRDRPVMGVSCGGGMINVCVAYRLLPIISFSIAKCGDWIDQSAAKALGIPVSQTTTIKEQGMSLKSPATREQQAIAIYYRSNISYFLESLAKVFNNTRDMPQFEDPVDIVFAGGSSMVGDFVDVVKEELKSVNLKMPVGEIKRADDPFTSVTRGCLFHAVDIQKSKAVGSGEKK